MRIRLAVAIIASLAVAGPAAQAPPDNPFESAAPVVPGNAIDEVVFARLNSLNIQRARVCSDAVFVRRAYLDVIGTLPTADEARAFIADQDPSKRSTLIDRLLARDEFADYWAMKWSDLLRVKSEFPINLWPNAVQAYHHWIRAGIRDDVPYDQFTRDLLTSSGSNFRVPPVNFYRAVRGRDPQTIATAVALTFMGARAEKWPEERLAGMAAFFSAIGYKPTGEWKEEIVFFDREKAPAVTGAPRAAEFPDGTAASIAEGQDPRAVFAAWLVSPKNPWFARAAANRVWFWLMGRGIVHEPDDIRPDNPPVNPELLALLERELVGAHFDLKRLYRLILNSTTYQLSAIPSSTRPEAEANFAHALLRPLDAEVLIDAVNAITGSTEQYSSAIPEPYTFIPPDQRTIQVADGSITSSFLVAFGRSPRDTGLLSERNNRPTAAERLYLLNGGDIQRKIQQSPKLQALLTARGDWQPTLANLYLTILSRYPTAEERRAAGDYAQAAGANRRLVGQDLAWALINSAEFRYRH
jgi:hypothetical protein